MCLLYVEPVTGPTFGAVAKLSGIKPSKAQKARAASRGWPVGEVKIVEPQPDRGL